MNRSGRWKWYLGSISILVLYLAAILNWLAGDLRFASESANYGAMVFVHLLPAIGIIVCFESGSLTLKPAGLVVGTVLLILAVPCGLWCANGFILRIEKSRVITQVTMLASGVVVVALDDGEGALGDFAVELYQQRPIIAGLVWQQRLTRVRGARSVVLEPAIDHQVIAYFDNGVTRKIRLKDVGINDDV